jgi:hypothetical protein
VNPNPNANYYARVLRAIGQDLAELFPHQLEIEQKERTLVVQARCDRKRSESKAAAQHAETAQAGGIRGFIHKLNTIRIDKPPDKPEVVTVTRAYDPIDISRIDEAGLHRRIQLGKIPDIHDLGEVLRTVGRIIDADEGKLVKIFRDQRRISFQYVTRSGETKKMDLTRAELVKIQQNYYHGRGGRGSLDLWKGKA